MPVHDWTRVDAGLFHDFHQAWTTSLRNELNGGVLPANYFALIEQRTPGPIPDVLTLELTPQSGENADEGGGVAVAAAPPKTSLVHRSDCEVYAAKASRIVIRHRHGRVVAIIEIVSPGNKESVADLRDFVDKAATFIQKGVNMLVLDLFPPSKRDPFGIHKAIWDQFSEEDVKLPAGKPLTLASYDSGTCRVAYVSFVGVGDKLPDMPVFLRPEHYVSVPLEKTYQAAWEFFPGALKPLLSD